jgi:hypothetical protein
MITICSVLDRCSGSSADYNSVFKCFPLYCWYFSWVQTFSRWRVYWEAYGKCAANHVQLSDWGAGQVGVGDQQIQTTSWCVDLLFKCPLQHNWEFENGGVEVHQAFPKFLAMMTRSQMICQFLYRWSARYTQMDHVCYDYLFQGGSSTLSVGEPFALLDFFNISVLWACIGQPPGPGEGPRVSSLWQGASLVNSNK